MAVDDLRRPDPGFGAAADTREEGLHVLEALLARYCRVDYFSQRSGAGDTHQGSGGNQIGEIEARNRQLFGVLHNGSGADRDIWLKGVHGVQVVFE